VLTHAVLMPFGRGTVAHSGDAAATRGRARATSRLRVPGPDALHVPLFGCAIHKIFNVNPSNRR
jgi:hypothetical protein